MKLLWLSTNRRGRRGPPRLSLFPFLAVLICTMGALVLLLLSVTRQARLQAAKSLAIQDVEKQSTLQAELENVQWRIEQLKQSRKASEAQLAEARLILGHIEDHGRRLREQFQQLNERAKQAQADGLQPGHMVFAGEEELRQVERQIAETQQKLAQVQKASGERPHSYAIVPYDGSSHTRRRPIYIECRSDAIVLQPENIVFNETDFDEPLGPGNPLAAAVRAAREYMLLQGSDPKAPGEPYPLMLVRPSGIAAYEAAIGAMKSWGPEYGYEMINEDWPLNYPPANPGMEKAIAQAVAMARAEHVRLIAAAPSKYGKRARSGSYRTSTGDDSADGDAVGGGGTHGPTGGNPGFYSSKPAERYAGSYADGKRAGNAGSRGVGGADGSRGAGRSATAGFGGGTSDLASGDRGSGPADDFAMNNPYAALPPPGAEGTGTGGNGVGSNGMAGAAALGSPNSGNLGIAGNGQTTQPATQGGQQTATNDGTMAGGPAAPPMPRPEGYINGRPTDGKPTPQDSSLAMNHSGPMIPETPLRPGEWRPTPEVHKPNEHDREEEEKEKKKHPYDKVKPDRNQDDWALREHSRHSAAISRPIHVDCYADRLAIVPEAGNGETRIIPMQAGSERDSNKFVVAVWEIMDSWGMAGREMYWRPVIGVYVAPGAESRFVELNRSLEGSGLVIERKQ